MKKPFSWDHNSDQPYQLKDRTFKKAMRKKELISLIGTLLSTLLIAPIAILLQTFIPKRSITTQHFFGMSINLDKNPEITKSLIDELGIDTVLIRFELWEMDNINTYFTFTKQYQDKKIILNIMQDREHVEDLALLKKDLTIIFEKFSPYVASFQIGSTINRAKWGFFSVREYLRFYQVAYELKQQFPKIKLLGPSVIDFEYHFTIHALFNFFRLKYDAISTLLYVDRRGAPENAQLGYDLLKKIKLLDALALLSPKTKRKIYITETNWPISNTAPFAPTSEHECVDEESYANFMVRYYLLAFASQKIDAVYWHQLIAPGYGLIDNRDGIRKRSAFDAFKTMLMQLENMQFVNYTEQNDYFTLTLKSNTQHLQIHWALQKQNSPLLTPTGYISRDGQHVTDTEVYVGPAPIYLIKKNTHAI